MIIGKNKVLTSQQIGGRFAFLRTLVSLILALAIAFLLILTVSGQAAADMMTLLFGPLTSMSRITVMVNKWIPLLFTGTAVCLMFSCGQINLAAEGAFFAGAYTGALVALLNGVPPVLHFLLCAVAGAAAGAVICGIPAVMNAKFNVLTVVSSLMINYVALYLGLFIMTNLVRDPSVGYVASYKFNLSAKLFELISGTGIHAGLLIAAAIVAGGWFLLYKTTFGLEIRTIGSNHHFAGFSGMPVLKTLVLAQIAGGLIAGLGGTVEVLGLYDRFAYGSLTNHGWDGVTIAVLARNNPKNVPLAALFLAYLRTSADVLNRTSSVPTEVVNIIQAVIIIFVAAERFLAGWEHRTIVKNTRQVMAVNAQEGGSLDG